VRRQISRLLQRDCAAATEYFGIRSDLQHHWNVAGKRLIPGRPAREANGPYQLRQRSGGEGAKWPGTIGSIINYLEYSPKQGRFDHEISGFQMLPSS
jgi:hypothetical protein